MTGTEFYELLRQSYKQDGQILIKGYTFKEWLYKRKTGSWSFRFNVPGQFPKSIPQDILINAWQAEEQIDDKWLLENFNVIFHSDCRLHVLNYLIKSYKDHLMPSEANKS